MFTAERQDNKAYHGEIEDEYRKWTHWRMLPRSRGEHAWPIFDTALLIGIAQSSMI